MLGRGSLLVSPYQEARKEKRGRTDRKQVEGSPFSHWLIKQRLFSKSVFVFLKDTINIAPGLVTEEPEVLTSLHLWYKALKAPMRICPTWNPSCFVKQ